MTEFGRIHADGFAEAAATIAAAIRGRGTT
jgi:hypothetical protein